MALTDRQKIEVRCEEIKEKIANAQFYRDTEHCPLMRSMACGMVHYLIHQLGEERAKLCDIELRYAA